MFTRYVPAGVLEEVGAEAGDWQVVPFLWCYPVVVFRRRWRGLLVTRCYDVRDWWPVVTRFEPGDRPWVAESREVIMAELAFLGKARRLAKGSDGAFAVVDADFEKRFPALYVFLTSVLDGAGEPRDLARISVFADAGAWRGSLVDVDTRQSLFVTVQKPADVFAALEKALQVDSPDWRAWRDDARARKPKGRG